MGVKPASPADAAPPGAPSTETPPPPGDRARRAALKARAKRLAERAETERTRHASVDAAFEIVDHDSEIGGGIMAGALAYRLFIWLLPLGLVAIAGLGLGADGTSGSPESAAKTLGLAGLVTDSVSQAAKSNARWYALLVGVPVLLMVTRSVLRTLIGIHRLVWTDVRAAVPRPTVPATVVFLFALVGYFVLTALGAAARAASPGLGLVVTLVVPVAFGGLWLLISMRLPHRDAPWRALVPGAVLFGVGCEALHAAIVYLIAPYASSKQGAYGSLGVAATLLLGLFMISRLMVATAVLNATLWRRRTGAG